MAETSTAQGKGKKDRNKKILIGLGIVVVGIAIWLLMRRKKSSGGIFLNITNYSASNYAPLSDAQVKSELEKANALVESKGVDGAISDLQSQVATLESQGTPESLALAKLLKDFIADLQMQKENQVKSATGGVGSMNGSMIGSMGGSQPMAVMANVNDPQFAPLTPAQVQSEVDSTNASLVADGLPNTIKSINDRITALSGSTNPQDIAQVRLLQYLLNQLTTQSLPVVTIDTANNSYAPLTASQIKAEVDATNASLSTNGVQSTLNTLNSRINQLAGSTNPSDIAMSSLLQNLASQLSGLASSSGTPYGSTTSSMGLPIGSTTGMTTMATTTPTTMATTPMVVSPTTSFMALPTTMTPSTMLNIPPPAPAVPSLSNPIIHTCGTYSDWQFIAGTSLWNQIQTGVPSTRTGQELNIGIGSIFGANYVVASVLPTNGLPSIVPFMLIKITLTIIPTTKNGGVANCGLKIGFKNPSTLYSSPATYQQNAMFSLTASEIGSGGVFTLTGVVPQGGGNHFYLVGDSTQNSASLAWGANFKLKVETGGCVSGAIVNTPLNISTSNMLTTGSVNDLLTKPTTTTTSPISTTTSPISTTTSPTSTTTLTK